DRTVTGVQTCALPISQVGVRDLGAPIVRRDIRLVDLRPSPRALRSSLLALRPPPLALRSRRSPLAQEERAGQGQAQGGHRQPQEIGRASCREGVWVAV